MDSLAYLHLQLRLEGKEVFNQWFVKQVEAVPEEDVPLVLIARLPNQELITYYDEAISPGLQHELATVPIEFPNIDSLIHILGSHHIPFAIGCYKTYIFPSQPAKDTEVQRLSKLNPKVKAFRFDSFATHVYAIECGGQLVSACVSTRENERCGEAWVYTDPEYRQQGFAQKVVNAWAKGLIDAGKVPFYSHKVENIASARLANKLGLQPVFEEICISQVSFS